MWLRVIVWFVLVATEVVEPVVIVDIVVVIAVCAPFLANTSHKTAQASSVMIITAIDMWTCCAFLVLAAVFLWWFVVLQGWGPSRLLAA